MESSPFSLNQFPIAAPHTKIELVGRELGVIASHELGHIFGNHHTFSPQQHNIMDTAIIFSLMGPDGVFGTDDDVDADFGIDNYFFEGFFGIQDTLNVIAFGLATGKGTTGAPTSAPSTTRSFTEPSSLNAIGLIEPNQAGISRAFPSLLTTSVPPSTVARIIWPTTCPYATVRHADATVPRSASTTLDTYFALSDAKAAPHDSRENAGELDADLRFGQLPEVGNIAGLDAAAALD